MSSNSKFYRNDYLTLQPDNVLLQLAMRNSKLAVAAHYVLSVRHPKNIGYIRFIEDYARRVYDKRNRTTSTG